MKSTKEKDLSVNRAKVQKHPRTPLKGEVLIHDDENLFIAPLENLSSGGAFIGRLMAMPAGRMVSLVIRSNELSPPLQARGEIIRIESSLRQGSAVQFHTLSTADRYRIDQYIKNNSLSAVYKVT